MIRIRDRRKNITGIVRERGGNKNKINKRRRIGDGEMGRLRYNLIKRNKSDIELSKLRDDIYFPMQIVN